MSSGQEIIQNFYDCADDHLDDEQKEYHQVFLKYITDHQSVAFNLRVITDFPLLDIIQKELGIPQYLFDFFVCIFYIQNCYHVFKGKKYTGMSSVDEEEWMSYSAIPKQRQKSDRKRWKQCLDNAKRVFPEISKSIYFGIVPITISDHKIRTRFCISCGRREVFKEVRLGTCAGCNIVTYCSEQCQAKDWKYHKLNCK